MALALQDLSIPCTVYEAQDTQRAHRTYGGAMMISPNAMYIMNRLGIYQRLESLGYPFEYVWFKNAGEKTIDKYPMGGKAFGYNAMRIYRQELLETLFQACRERLVPILFGKKFVEITKETNTGVEFDFEDGTSEKATLLIGADGIHSKVRSYVCPGIEPKFVGMTALTWVTPTKDLRIPDGKDYQFPVSVLTTNGVLVMAPQRPDGSEMFTGTQFPIEDQTREGWDALLADKDKLVARARQNIDVWPDIAKSAIENLDPESFNLWPFRLLPPLPNWTSQSDRRVVILGDAARMCPPDASCTLV
jgi:2-polyprenyl-6-methoxyphenol hydroxylase-like FAD-dependent oxidoreductase